MQQQSKDKILTHSGYIAIIGRPNVGKSTLLNRILGKKISITSKKPQTTRHKILGIKTTNGFQAIYIDTPGIHQKDKRVLNKLMDKTVSSVISDVDVIVFVVEGIVWKTGDDLALKRIENVSCPVILAINKVDNIINKEKLLFFIQNINKKRQFFEIIPISAEKGTNISALEKSINKLLPEGPLYFSADEFTDRDQRFMAAEIIREKLMRFLGEELPYSTTVAIDFFTLKNDILHIGATIFVEKIGQKAIVIGAHGDNLKKIGTFARKDMENLFKQKIFLNLWVKVKSNWTQDRKLLEGFGY